MQFKTFIGALVMAGSLTLMACVPSASSTQPVSQSSTPSTSGQDVSVTPQSCPANELQYLVGQPRTVLQTMRFGGTVRFEEPGQMVTQDYSAARTRIIIGANGEIERVVCG